MMNTNLPSSILHFISSLCTTLFGQFKWNSPPWLVYLHDKAKTSPKVFWTIATLIIMALFASTYAVIWYKQLPKPVYVTASITAPPITTNNEDTLIPNPLVINFGINREEFITQSVAPIGSVGKTVTEGIEIKPHIAGQWFWNSDSQLSFTPDADWPAGQTYHVYCAQNVFAPNANIKDRDFVFSTQAFQATMSEFKFYQDPIHSEERNAVATIQFNFPVNAESLEKHTSLAFQAVKKGAVNIQAEPLKFTYTYDKNKRVAYLRSETIKIKDTARYVLLTLGKKVSSSTDSDQLKKELTANLLIPDSKSVLKVLSTGASILRNEHDKPEQVLTVDTSIGINENEFNKSVHFYLLPKDYPATSVEAAKENYQWTNPGEVTNNILALATPLTKQPIPTEQNYSALHSYKFSAPTPRYIYVKIDKGMKGFGDFVLNDSYAEIIAVPEIPKEISFLHQGSLLALNSVKKLSVLVRGLPAVKFDFARVLPNNINQLVTQTHGDFNNPYFINPSFNQQNISKIFTDTQQFDASDLQKQQYTALDLGQYLSNDANTSGPQGLFLLQATGWDPINKTTLDIKASRLVLITDLAMIVKDNNDSSHDVFVTSITQGTPVADVSVTVLGKNGLAVISQKTDDQGRAHFPSLKDFIEDKEPVAYLAQQNNDVSFIPFANESRRLNFTKFDIGGVYANNQDNHSLKAFVFSDRGIYRPGDTIHIGMIVKQAFAASQPAGLPLQATIIDSRGTVIKDEKLILNDTGYMELDFTTNATSPTGQYTVNLNLVKDKYSQSLLGSTTLKVAEFLPDRMRISAKLSPTPSEGWTNPVGLKAKVELWNLYGAPAQNRRISGKILLSPAPVEFSQYPEVIFSDPLQDPKKPAQVFTESLSDIQTNDKGEAEFNLNLERFEKATYQLTFFAEGFEAEGGRSVTSQSKTLISPLPYFVGYKPDGDLAFLKQNAARTIHYIAINPKLEQEEIRDLKIQLVSLHPVTTLVKKANGTYQYQSIIQSKPISTNPFAINKEGTDYTIPTQDIGDYSLSVLNQEGTVLSQLKFSVVGSSQSAMARNAQLSLKLNKTQYQANEEIELQITAPYTGSGLITIERDKLYATQWFKTQTTNSVQRIRIPAEFQGNGYVNLAFVRDWDSPELFISPLSYSIVPFEMNHDAHDIKIELETPKVARPGETLTIDYKSNKPSKIIVYAVDEGILQVAHYTTPDPLAFFFQKYALEVSTQQTVDQILPKFIQDREMSAPGGDGGEEELAGRLNPFKRKTDLPVVFWSGIVDSDTTSRQVSFHVPDYFNGQIKLMAVAVSADAVGSEESAVEVRGDFIINPNVPTFVAPGDEFELSSSIANQLKGSGENAEITVQLSISPELELIGPAVQTILISEGHEQTVHYKLRAKSVLGSAKITFKASSKDKANTMDSTLSVRPANPFMTDVKSGMSNDSHLTLDILQTLYPEHRQVTATMSTSPLILVFGLQRFLDDFPFGCTEQLTSKALPLLAMNKQPWFEKDGNQLQKQINATIQMLGQRQMSQGGFSYWPGLRDNQANSFATVYAMHFLTEARAQGFSMPNEMFSNGISYLKELASHDVTDKNAARIQAYAIYILTRNELVTTNYLANLQRYLQQDVSKAWEKDITGVYIAASYQMLKSFEEANHLINQYVPQNTQIQPTDFYDMANSDAQYLYIVAKHFPDKLNQVGNNLLMEMAKSINKDELNTLLAGYASLALGAYPQSDIATPSLSITQTTIDNEEQPITSDLDYLKLDIAPNIKKITFNNSGKQSFFYQLTQAGFNKTDITEPLSRGLEIFREYRDAQGHVIQSTTLGSEIEVHLQIRALDNKYLTNIAIEDLLPGGFEVVRDSVKTDTMDYADAREDRVNFFGMVDSTTKQIIYKIKAVNIGTYKVPPAFAQSMYNPEIQARGKASEITIGEAAKQ